jgi:glycosyltransferase involved in cell wall biosynthesis
LVSDQETRQRLAKNGRAEIMHFTPTEVGRQILNAYDDVLENRLHR